MSADLDLIAEEGKAVSYSLRELLGQPELADTVDALLAALARVREQAAASEQIEQAARQVISAAEAMENGGRGVPPAQHAHLSMVKAEGELLLAEALAAAPADKETGA